MSPESREAHAVLRRILKMLCAMSLPLAAPVSLDAQTVAGRAVSLNSERTLSGTAAALVDDSARIVTRGRADAEGIFALQAAKPGRYRVVLFVAGGSFVSPTFALEAGDYVEREFAIPEVPASFGELYFATDVDRPAVYHAANPTPRYPASLRRRELRGLVSAMFVVDSSGRADMSTFQVLTEGPSEFTEAVREVLPEWMFDPAERGGARVPQVVHLTFDFGLGDDPPRGDIVIRAIGIVRSIEMWSSPEE